MRVATEAPLINRNESWIRNPAGAFGIWDRWVASTGVPVHEGYFVPDMRTIELGWWEERKCNAARHYEACPSAAKERKPGD